MSDAPTRTPEVFSSHANARTNEYGRKLALERVLAGQSVKDVAAQLGISRTTVYKWLRRFHLEGPAVELGITNARTEGYNRVIKQVKRAACGFRNQDNYERRIMLHIAARRAA